MTSSIMAATSTLSEAKFGMTIKIKINLKATAETFENNKESS
jgi:hypothetical protein